jgi:hypothetical protein
MVGTSTDKIHGDVHSTATLSAPNAASRPPERGNALATGVGLDKGRKKQILALQLLERNEAMIEVQDSEKELLDARWNSARTGSQESHVVLDTDTEQRMNCREPLVSTYTKRDEEGPPPRFVAYSRTRKSQNSEWGDWHASFD